MVAIACKQCNNLFNTTTYLISIKKGKFCSRKCCDLFKIGKKQSLETIEKRRIANIGKHKMSEWHKNQVSLAQKGKVLSEETKQKIREKRKLQVSTNRGMTWKIKDTSNYKSKNVGELNGRWISDRSKLKKYDGSEERRSPAYKYWRQQVWLRDDFKCKIANPDCCGRIEAHHILVWKDYPELRYKINNGITLCHAHHPRKRAEEKRLESYFMELVSVSSK